MHSLYHLLVLGYSKYKLALDKMGFLWKLLVKQCAGPEDQAMFYRFLKDFISLGPLENHVFSISEMSVFFTEIICDERNNFQQLPVEGMEAIESLLIEVNKSLGNIIDQGSAKKVKIVQIGPQLPEVGDNEFSVAVQPTQIKGVSVLWKIVLEAKNETVSMKAIELLNKLYTKLGEELQGRIAEISTQFVETAIEKVRVFYDQMAKAGENRGREIVKLLKLIDEMLDESERKGNGGITPLQAVLKGVPVRLNIVNNAVDPLLNPDIPQKVTIAVHSSVTLWQLKATIADILHLLPESVSEHTLI